MREGGASYSTAVSDYRENRQKDFPSRAASFFFWTVGACVCEIEKQHGGRGSNRSRLKASPTFSHLGGGAGPHVQQPAIAQHGFLLTVGPGDEFITSQRKTTTTPVTKVHHTFAAVSSCEAEKLVK